MACAGVTCQRVTDPLRKVADLRSAYGGHAANRLGGVDRRRRGHSIGSQHNRELLGNLHIAGQGVRPSQARSASCAVTPVYPSRAAKLRSRNRTARRPSPSVGLVAIAHLATADRAGPRARRGRRIHLLLRDDQLRTDLHRRTRSVAPPAAPTCLPRPGLLPAGTARKRTNGSAASLSSRPKRTLRGQLVPAFRS